MLISYSLEMVNKLLRKCAMFAVNYDELSLLEVKWLISVCVKYIQHHYAILVRE